MFVIALKLSLLRWQLRLQVFAEIAVLNLFSNPSGQLRLMREFRSPAVVNNLRKLLIADARDACLHALGFVRSRELLQVRHAAFLTLVDRCRSHIVKVIETTADVCDGITARLGAD